MTAAGSLSALDLDTESVLRGVPTDRQLAAALSDPDSRKESLMTLIAVERLLADGAMAHPPDVDELVRRFNEDRNWLERVAAAYREVPMKGSQLDPAAWFVLLELSHYEMEAGSLAGPAGPGFESLLRRLFDRGNEGLAAAVLPEVLQRMEVRSVLLWQEISNLALLNPALAKTLADLNDRWFDPWSAAEPPAPGIQESSAAPIPAAAESLEVIAFDLTSAGPPDALRLKKLRFSLLMALPSMTVLEVLDASYLLALASALEGLNESRYLAFAETLLWVASDLLLAEGAVVPDPPAINVATEQPVENAIVPRLLYSLLPRLSSSFAVEFSDVDPRINNILAAVYDTVQYLQSGQAEQARLTALRSSMADSVAQLVLLLSEMSYYYDQPVRWPISEEIDICLGLMAVRAPDGSPGLGQERFDGCMEKFIEIADERAGREDLSGDMDGPFGSDQLRRELVLPSWQRINFILGYLHEQYAMECGLPERPLPNPVEWAGMANLVAWFASQAPAYLRAPANRERIERLRRQGHDLLRLLSQQVDCISAAGAGISDPVVRGLADYRSALGELVAGVREAELAFRTDRLKPGADVVLHGDALQQTAYRSENLSIGPCDPERVCQMDDELEASRPLIGLFPGPYLVSDQTGMGEIEICYDNVRWVDRRAEPVRPDDPYVANYFGRLSFDIIGRHHEKGETTNVFGYSFITPDEHHYLFAAATEEVAEDPCPTEWVGSRIVTPLSNLGGVRVVPDRLTYLAGSRSEPSDIIRTNWSRGQKWQDWLVSGVGVFTPHQYPEDAGIADRVNRHLQALYEAKQSALYANLLRPPLRSGRGDPHDLFELQEELDARKALVRTYLTLFYPEFVTGSDEIRGSLEGRSALLDTAMLRSFREDKVAVSTLDEAGNERLDRFQTVWNRQPDAVRRSGSVGISVVHALIRLNDVYIRYLTEKEVMRPGGLRG